MTNSYPSHFLLAADIDGTLLGDETGEALLHQFFEKHNQHFTLAYVTGRSLESVQELISENRLPNPHFISSEVGTEILDLRNSTNHIGREYAAQVSANWDLETIYQLGTGDGIYRQEFKRGQPRYQAGFHWDARPESLVEFRERLAPLGQLYIQASFNMYIDVMPSTVGKGNAVRFLQRQLGLSTEQVVIAGDSGNDRQMFETEYKGIVPVNALDELKKLARQPWHYHSPLPAGRGVLDGLRHFSFLKDNSSLA